MLLIRASSTAKIPVSQMKRFFVFTALTLAFCGLAVLGAPAAPARTRNIGTWTWTGLNGDWYSATNWFPGSVPPAGADVVIQAGTVSLSAPVMVTGSLTLGAAAIGGNPLTIASNAAMNLQSNATLNNAVDVAGTLNWTGGYFSGASSLFVEPGGGLNLNGIAGTDYIEAGVMTNAGTLTVTGGNLDLFAGAHSLLVNLPGGLIDFQSDGAIAAGSAETLIVNQGTVRKSGGAGTNLIWASFDNSGTLDVQTGAVALESAGSGGGVFQADAGAVLELPNGYNAVSGARFLGAGTNLWSGGLLTLGGQVVSENAVLAGAEVAGTNVISGTLTWTSGFFDGRSKVKIATNGALLLAGINGTDYVEAGVLTNAGTIILSSGNLNLAVTGQSRLVNLPSGTIYLQSDVSIDAGASSVVLLNQGYVLKTGGSETSFIQSQFDNTGELYVATGTVSLTGTANFTNGKLAVGIEGPTNYGVINVAGSVYLDAVGLQLDPSGYDPVVGDSFAVVTYGSETGSFITSLPRDMTWQTSYGANAFSVTATGTTRPYLTSSLHPTPGQPPEFGLRFNVALYGIYVVLATTNPSLPLASWPILNGHLVPTNNVVQFTDTQSTNFPMRFYYVYLPAEP